MALRKKIPTKDFELKPRIPVVKPYQRTFQRQPRGRFDRNKRKTFRRGYKKPFSFNRFQRNHFVEEILEPITPEERELFQPIMDSVKGKLSAKLFNEEKKELAEVPVRELMKELPKTKKVSFIVFDGIATKRLVEKAKELGVKTLVGIKKGKIGKIEGIKVLIFN